MSLENFPTNETAKRMLSMISPIYDESYVGKWIFQVMGLYFGEATEAVHKAEQEAFPNTTTEMIEAWEELYGIPPNPSLSIEERRRAVLYKRNFKRPMNPARIEQMVREITGREATVVENTGRSTYDIHIYPGSNIVDYDDVVKAVKESKQSNKHVNIRFVVAVGVNVHVNPFKIIYPIHSTSPDLITGRYPDRAWDTKLEDLSINIRPRAGANVYPHIVAGTKPDVNTVGALMRAEIEAGIDTESRVIPFDAAGTKPDINRPGASRNVSVNINASGKGSAALYETTGTSVSTGTEPDVNVSGRMAEPGVTAHIAGRSADVVYKICGADKL